MLSSASNSQLDAPDGCAIPSSLRNEPNSCTNEEEKCSDAAKIVPGPKILEAQRELKRLLQLRLDKPNGGTDIDFAAKRHLIVCNDSGLQLVEMSKELQESIKCDTIHMADLISQECFDKVS